MGTFLLARFFDQSLVLLNLLHRNLRVIFGAEVEEFLVELRSVATKDW
jgi:hypothetical protein